MGNIIAEMLTTSLGKTKRFDLMERGQLQKVMQEQGFSQSGFVDEETAKKIGKLIAVDLLITGTFSELTDSLRIDLRAIDTETGEIVYTEGLQSKGKSTDDLNLAAAEIAERVRQAFPLLEGKIIMVKDENSYLVDLGKEKSTTQGLRLVVYREGEDIVIDGVNYGKEIKVLGEIVTVEVQDKYSVCKLVKHKIPDGLKQGDKVVSK
jgi:TolB-like protein